MVTYGMTSGNQPFGVWSAKAQFARSDDLWKTKYTLLPRGNRFLFLDKFIFVAVVNKHHETQVNLYVSSEGGGPRRRSHRVSPSVSFGVLRCPSRVLLESC